MYTQFVRRRIEMSSTVERLCLSYVSIVKRIHRAYDPGLVYDLEQQRQEVHSELMRALRNEGHRMNRDEAADFAFEVAG
jgi:hypothetical protein